MKIGFRPLMGIILFNRSIIMGLLIQRVAEGFRPLMGIILFNKRVNDD